ncbi:IS91 family transposase [Clostridium sp. DJ247]|uniref:IS91 family transposase n=1 Tax=Clostridium sp. DJ247 TaxID=2726188 RepID=UPI0016253BAB|nr:IS91 family transposase [Clostridium sp. DJ247]MBC2579085.1 IS91 family transposase [Clostridium sp. DJ247]
MNSLQNIIELHGESYIKSRKLPSNILKALYSIKYCRTAALGGHVYECDECGETKISYNSCRNRHCPKCQAFAKEMWIYERSKALLPTHYFHIVFTIPEQLNSLTLFNQKEMYSILFTAVSETLLKLAKAKKYLNANIGFTTILHTWGQNLMYHPHIHCIVPGGGLSLDNSRWIKSKKKFFIPVKVLSQMFRGKYLFYLNELYKRTRLKFPTKIKELQFRDIFNAFKDSLYKKEWIVYSKAPFSSAEYVLQYLGRYTHRVAISNNRIIKVDNENVIFKWRDYKEKSKEKIMSLKPEEFIRRFSMHILPDRFVKIRHYGILGNRNKNLKFKRCIEIFRIKPKELENLSSAELFFKLTGIEIGKCKKCEKGNLIKLGKIMPRSALPP